MDRGIDHGFSTPTDDDHRAWLWTASLLSLIYALLTAGARITSKWGLLWYDDAILAIGYVFGLAHYGLVFASIATGLGATSNIIASASMSKASQTYFYSRICSLLCLCMCKMSVISFTRRIFHSSVYRESKLFATSFGFILGWGILATVLSSAACDPDNALIAEPDAVCLSNKTRWIVITVLDVATDLLLVAVPVWLVSKNQISASKKRVVSFVFGFRLCVASTSIAAMTSYFNFLDGDRDSIGLAPTVAWQEVLIGCSIITASIPSLRTFLWAFMSRGIFTMYGVRSHTESGTGTGTGSQALRSARRRSQPENEVMAVDEAIRLRDRGQLSGRAWHEESDYHSGAGARYQITTSVSGGRIAASECSTPSDRVTIRRDIEIEIEQAKR